MQSRIDELAVRLIRNTIKRNSSRADNILIIAKDIEELIKLTGSIKTAAKLINISPIMLKKFLSVNRLSKDVKKFVEQRKFDNVQAIYDIKSLSEEEQLAIVKNVIDKKISASDVKALIPEKNKNKNVPIEKLINKLVASKDIKIFSAFIVSSNKISAEELETILFQVFDKKHIHSFTTNGYSIKISFTKEGYDYIKEKSRNNKQTIKEYLNSVVNG